MSQTLYRKYRPQTWADVAGQNHVKITLEFELASGRVAHAYLFSGPRGVGKTTVARLMAKALNCTKRDEKSEPCGACDACVSIMDGAALDVVEIDAASHRTVEEVRETIVESARFAPSKLAYKVFIIDEVHMLSDTAFNSLLKTIEEPPKRTIFILATTELHKVPATIVSRCQRFDFRKIPFTDLVERLHALAEREKCKVDKRTLEEIARGSDGCLRDAEGLLGKVMSVGDGKRVTYDEALVVLPRSDYAALAAFTDALLHNDSRTALGVVGDCLEGGVDVEQFAGDAIELLRKVLLAKLAGNAGVFAPELDEERRAKISEWCGLAETPRLVRAIETLLEKKQDMKRAHPVQLPLELAVVRICEGISVATDERRASPGTVSADAVRAGSAKIHAPVSSTLAPAAAAPVVPAAAPAAHSVSGTALGVATERAKAEEASASFVENTVRTALEEAMPSDDRSAPLLTAVMDEAAPEPVAKLVAPMPPADGKAVTSVAALRSMWKQFVERAGEENHALPFLLGVGEPVEVVGEKVCIGFDFAFHKDKLNEEKTRRPLEKVLGAMINAAVRVEGVLLEKNRERVHDEAAQFAPTARPFTPAVPVGGDSLISAFGGRVVE